MPNFTPSRLHIQGDQEITGSLTISGSLSAHSYDIIQTTVTEINSNGSTNFGDSNADTHIFTGNIYSSSSLLPATDEGADLGSSTKRWGNIYTGDLHLKNDRGDWTVIEEEDYLSLKNNKTGKRYKLLMQEIEEQE